MYAIRSYYGVQTRPAHLSQEGIFFEPGPQHREIIDLFELADVKSRLEHILGIIEGEIDVLHIEKRISYNFV